MEDRRPGLHIQYHEFMLRQAGGTGSMGKQVKRKKTSSAGSYNMKLVTSDVCEVCKQQCPRGIRYMERMRRPGAAGKGVPCILTRYKA